MQDEIARAILDTLKIKLAADSGAVVKPQTRNLEAYDLYLQGRYYWVRRYRGFVGKAVESFQRAIEKDPSYALAHAGLADCYTTLSIQGALPPAAAAVKAKTAAERAVVLGESLSETHTSMAFVRYFVDWDFDEAERECHAAMARNPNAGAPRGMLAAFLASRRQFDAALAEAVEARRCEPVSTLVGYYAAFARIFSGDFERAWEEGKALVELDPHLAQSYFVVAIAASSSGRHAEALEASKRALELSNGWSRAMSNLGATYGAAGQRDDARKILEELRRQSQERHVSPLDMAFIAAQIGEHAAACEWLERAHDEHQPLMMFAAVYPWLFPLRPMARFQQVLRRIGL
jgi:serine/threonine-protein kinase